MRARMRISHELVLVHDVLLLQLAGEELEIPDLPANFVMDEFLKAREKANLPKQGTVMEAASSWYQKHHD